MDDLLGPEPESGPPIDGAAIDALRELEDDGAPDFLRQVLRAFLDESLPAVERIAEALGGSDTDRVAVEAHGLKGASRSVGAASLASLCEEIERRRRARDLPGAAALAEKLRQEAARARACLEEILAGAPGR